MENRATGPRIPAAPDFRIAPFLAIWETTQACSLACRHCRAQAIDSRSPDELSSEEGKRLIDQVAAMGTPILIFSGGDPLQREDLDDLIRHAKGRGLRSGTIPAATPRLTAERVGRLQAAGLDQMALSLDGPDAATHDSFRGVPGAFGRTLEGARYAREAGLPLQVNTTFGAWNRGRFDAMAELVESLGVVFWEIFFLVPVGRGIVLPALRPREYEEMFARIHAVQKRAPFIVKITEAPHYRRFVAERERRVRGPAEAPAGARIRRLLAREVGPGGSLGQAPRGVNSGKGFVFISYRGDVYPSGFLPLRAGSVRERTLGEIYRDSPLFRELRDPARLQGRCGRCEYADLCGGSRARAWALTGDYLAEDPSCLYEPRAGRGHRAPAAPGRERQGTDGEATPRRHPESGTGGAMAADAMARGGR